jgi:ABC-2 type transport system permease protein
MLDMSRIWLIARREWTTRLKQRSFQITTVIQILVVLAAALSPVIIARFVGDEASAGVSIVVVDEADAGIAQRMSPYLQGDGNTLEPIATSDVESPEAARTLVDNGDADSALIATRGNDDVLGFTLVTDNGDWSSTNVQRIYAAASAIAMEDRLIQSGISEEQAQQVFSPVAFDVEGLSGAGADAGITGSNDSNTAEYAIAYLATILMFIAVMMYGTWIAQGVVEEKSSRIMEIMVNAATPRDLLAGKVIGIMMAGLTQLLPMLLVGSLAFGFQPRIADLVGVDVSSVLDIDFGALSARALGFFLLYFLCGFILYGSLYAGIGSLVSRQEEVSQAIAPMMTFMMIGYFGAFFVLGAPDSSVAKWLMIFPLTSPFSALPRILLGDPGTGEIVLSVLLLVFAAALGVWLAGKLYRVGVLMYGQRPSWKSLLRMGRMQQVAR